MSIIKHKDKRTGVTYVYESESSWDKEKKQPRSRRTLIGKLDEATGEIVPTRKYQKKGEAEAAAEKTADETVQGSTGQTKIIEAQAAEIAALKSELQSLRKEKQETLKILEGLLKDLR